MLDNDADADFSNVFLLVFSDAYIMFQPQIFNSANIFQKYGVAMLLQTQNAAVA